MESPNSKRLVFDRRYGWVFDEWKDPSEEALAGGRGMFCIVPLAKIFVDRASNSINFAAASTIRVLERPDLLSPQLLQANLSAKVHEFTCSIQKLEFSFFNLKETSKSHAASSSHLQKESTKSEVA